MKRVKANSGFTTAEMLITTLIMSLSFTLLANGVATIRNIYSKTMAKADAQMILSQVEITLRNDLSLVTKVEYPKADKNAEKKNILQYYIPPYWCRLVVEDGVLCKKRFLTQTPPPLSTNSGGALSTNSGGENVPISYQHKNRLENLEVVSVPNIQYVNSDGYFQVSKLKVTYQGDIVAGSDSDFPQYLIRALNKPELIENESG